MRTEYRKKPPYYGKYRYKLETGHFHIGNSITKNEEKQIGKEIEDYIKANIKKENYMIVRYCYTPWPKIYIVDKKDIDLIFASEYEKYIWYFTKPSPGYENAVKPKKEDLNSLWYGRYPYKIILRVEDHLNLEETLEWCEENMATNYSKTGYSGSVSYFFINAVDAMAFKLRFSDWIRETKIPDTKQAKRLLQKRVDEAKKDLEIFLEGA